MAIRFEPHPDCEYCKAEALACRYIYHLKCKDGSCSHRCRVHPDLCRCARYCPQIRWDKEEEK